MSEKFYFYCEHDGQSSDYGFQNMRERAERLLAVRDCVVNVMLADPWYMFEVDCGQENNDFVRFLFNHRGHEEIVVMSEYDKLPEVPFEHSH